jgi:SAM-dependent methyltransferase
MRVSSVDDCRKGETATATPAEPGNLWEVIGFLKKNIIADLFVPWSEGQLSNERPMNLDRTQREWFSQMRREWLTRVRVIDPHGEKIFLPYPAIPQELLNATKLFTDRSTGIGQLPKGGMAVEVGTYEGRFARDLLKVCQPTKLFLLDLTDADIKRAASDLIADPRIQLIVGDSSQSLSRFGDERFDWIYIDGDHRYEGVRNDLIQAARVVKRGGLLIFNDYTIWSPLEMLDYGVVQAVNEFLFRERWHVHYLAFHHLMYNDIAIRRPI